MLKRYASYKIDEPGRPWSFHVDRCEQPWYNVLKHLLFHRFFEPIADPFASAIERLIARYDKPRSDLGHDDWTLPLGVRVDLWCYDLGERNSKVLERIELNETTYDALNVVD